MSDETPRSSRRKSKALGTVEARLGSTSNGPASQPLVIRGSTLRLRRLTVTGSGGPIPTAFHVRREPVGWAADVPVADLQADAGAQTWTLSCTIPLEAFADGAERIDVHCGDAFGPHVLGLPLGRERAAGQVERLRHGQIEGWFSRLSAGSAIHFSTLQLCIDGHPVAALGERRSVEGADATDLGPAGGDFAIRLPAQVFDGRERRLTVRTGDTQLPGELRYRTQWIGHIDYFDGRRLVGWIADRNHGVDPTCYELRTKDGVLVAFSALDERTDVAANGGPLTCGFALQLAAPLDLLADDPRIVNTQCPGQVIFGAESFLDSRGHIAAARSLIDQLDSGVSLGERERWWLKRLCAESLPELRRSDRRLGHAHRFPRPLIPEGREHGRATTVLVPVYDGYDDTLACLRSIHAAVTKESACRVVVIDDRGPDRRLAHELPQLCRRFGFQFLRNPENLGFVGSVNRGMASFPNDDILLLNSDTIVPERFVSRMRSHLRDRKIASVTALSNNATILSYPSMNVENAMPAMDDVLELDRIFDKVNRGRSVEIPTGVGCCMLIRRDALDRIGLFDSIWGKGYCEENDWCIRASDLGYRHVAACDVFIGHVGGASFGPERTAHIETNLGILLRRYPEYQAEVQDFILRDPLSDVRRRVDLEILRRDPRRKVLLISIALGGGIERYVTDQALQLRSEGIYPLILRASREDRFTLSTSISLELEDGHHVTINNDDIRLVFQRDLIPLVDRIHLHTMVGIPIEVLDMLREAPVEKHFTAHDYAAVCPRVNLLMGDLTFCDLPPVSVCETCVAQDGAHPGLPGFREKFGSVEAWRAYIGTLLGSIQRCTGPSQDLVNRLRRVLPVPFHVLRPEEPSPYVEHKPAERARRDRVRLLIVGAIGEHKGLRMLKDIAKHILDRQLPFEIAIIGHTADDAFFASMPFVTITGRYAPQDAVARIQAAEGDCALFLSPWPETWSYTLSEVLEADVPVMALDLGAIGERLRAGGTGILVPPQATAEDICGLIADEYLRTEPRAPAAVKAAARRRKPVEAPARPRKVIRT